MNPGRMWQEFYLVAFANIQNSGGVGDVMESHKAACAAADAAMMEWAARFRFSGLVHEGGPLAHWGEE